ncbi:hypothetical protein [Haloarchaeobius sp. TZWWS8]|uniref:hypothetical protein n=1 Tax=Haloarchaeobius sp. TZWWS8 TaxID=3446121 RepID=UPI003EC03A38
MSNLRLVGVVLVVLTLLTAGTVGDGSTVSSLRDGERLAGTFSAGTWESDTRTLAGFVVLEDGVVTSDWNDSIRVTDERGEPLTIEIVSGGQGQLELRVSREIPDSVRVYFETGKLATALGVSERDLASASLELDGVPLAYELVTADDGYTYLTFVIDHFSVRTVMFVVEPEPASDDTSSEGAAGVGNESTDPDNVSTGTGNESAEMDNGTVGIDNETAGADNESTATDNETASADTEPAGSENESADSENGTDSGSEAGNESASDSGAGNVTDDGTSPVGESEPPETSSATVTDTTDDGVSTREDGTVSVIDNPAALTGSDPVTDG